MDIDVVSCEKEAIYLRVRIVPPKEKMCGCLMEWRYILLGKGLDVNAAKSIVMVGRRAVEGYSENVSVVFVGKECMLRYVYRM